MPNTHEFRVRREVRFLCRIGFHAWRLEVTLTHMPIAKWKCEHCEKWKYIYA